MLRLSWSIGGTARNLKSKRGELFGLIAVGYRKVAHEDRIEKEPDRRVQQAITVPSRAIEGRVGLVA